MEAYGPMLPCNTMKMKSEIMKQDIISSIFLCTGTLQTGLNGNSRKMQQHKVILFFYTTAAVLNIHCHKMKPITCNWILLLPVPQGTSVHFYMPLKNGKYSFVLKICFLHSLVVKGTAHRALLPLPTFGHIINLFTTTMATMTAMATLDKLPGEKGKEGRLEKNTFCNKLQEDKAFLSSAHVLQEQILFPFLTQWLKA